LTNDCQSINERRKRKMVNVIYGEHSQQVELAGKTVADVREMFESEFDLSDRAQANLNGQWLKKNLEAETGLYDDDELSFEERSRRGLVMLGAFLLTLALTGGLFAYTQTVTTRTIGVTGGTTDYCSVTSNATASPDYSLLGMHRGVIPEGSLFDVTPDNDYNGDLVLNLILSNVDLLQNDYSSWAMRVTLTNSSNVSIDTMASIGVITLDTPMVSFEVQSDNITASGGTVYVHCDGGSYRTFGHGWLSGVDPQVYAQVVQAGAH
jgi:hypothetical protein